MRDDQRQDSDDGHLSNDMAMLPDDDDYGDEEECDEVVYPSDGLFRQPGPP